jgi:AhpC/TSA antioxidant enzyme
VSIPLVGEPVPPELARARVMDRAGKERPLGESWANGPCLAVFLRHFGCIGCSEHVTALAPRLLEIAELGVGTVMVGSGAPDFIDGFVERQALGDKKVTILTDPSLIAFRAAGLERSRWGTFGPHALVDFGRALLDGHRHAGLLGDATQQGGTMLVDRGGVVRFLHRAAHLGDHPDPADVVDAVLWIAARESSIVF